MSDTTEVIYPAFSMAQHATLRDWSDRRPRGFRISIAADGECAEEMAYAYRRGEFYYYLHPTTTGRIFMGSGDGRDTWETDTVEEALDALLTDEAEIEAEWIADGR